QQIRIQGNEEEAEDKFDADLLVPK
ncbi:hypothetical protein A2U01_0066561, partial [Trifolium medium]|nr:hypothetical protein [Trifolium medium]